MKKIFIFLVFASTSFAFELSFDTINTGETKTLYVNSGTDTVRFDSARIDLVQSEGNQYQMLLVCDFTDRISGELTRDFRVYYFENYGEFVPRDSTNVFRLESRPDETVKILLDGFDYCLSGIPENGPAPLTPPKPMQAKMVIFTSRGSDSIIINGMQTNQPSPNAVIKKQIVTGKTNTRGVEYYSIDGKRVNESSPSKPAQHRGVGIIIEKHPDGSVVNRNYLLLH